MPGSTPDISSDYRMYSEAHWGGRLGCHGHYHGGNMIQQAVVLSRICLLDFHRKHTACRCEFPACFLPPANPPPPSQQLDEQFGCGDWGSGALAAVGVGVGG